MFAATTAAAEALGMFPTVSAAAWSHVSYLNDQPKRIERGGHVGTCRQQPATSR